MQAGGKRASNTYYRCVCLSVSVSVCMCVCVCERAGMCVVLSYRIDASETRYLLQVGRLVVRAEPDFRGVIRGNSKLVQTCTHREHTADNRPSLLQQGQTCMLIQCERETEEWTDRIALG